MTTTQITLQHRSRSATQQRPKVPLQQRVQANSAPDLDEPWAPFRHELGNLVNGLLLESRALERDLPEAFQGRARSLRQLATDIANSMRRFDQQQHGRRRPTRGLTGKQSGP